MKKYILYLLIQWLSVACFWAQDVTFKFANEQYTNGGNAYEVDVMIESEAGFKLGAGQLYFHYNTLAFGENVFASNRVTITHSSGSILATTTGTPPTQSDVYNQFTMRDNASNRFSFAWQQAYSEACLSANNVTATPAVLFHLQLDFLPSGINEPPNLCFESDDWYMDQNFMACGPSSCEVADCINEQGTQITNDKVDCSVILPVGLLSFRVQLEEESTALLTWKTAIEINTNYFEIERKVEKMHWETIGTVTAKGKPNVLTNYAFRDKDLRGTTLYYRLKMWDWSGTFEYSPIEVIQLDLSQNIRFFPNPVTNELIVELKLSNPSVARFTLINAANQLIWTQDAPAEVGLNQLIFPFSSLSNGVYFMKVELGSWEHVERIVVQK